MRPVVFSEPPFGFEKGINASSPSACRTKLQSALRVALAKEKMFADLATN
jgi:hypothetical protein